MRIDMCIDLCIDPCVDMCIGMCAGICVDIPARGRRELQLTKQQLADVTQRAEQAEAKVVELDSGVKAEQQRTMVLSEQSDGMRREHDEMRSALVDARQLAQEMRMQVEMVQQLETEKDKLQASVKALQRRESSLESDKMELLKTNALEMRRCEARIEDLTYQLVAEAERNEEMKHKLDLMPEYVQMLVDTHGCDAYTHVHMQVC